MPAPALTTTSVHFRRLLLRPSVYIPTATFTNARVKWVRDFPLDALISTHNHLRPFLAVKSHLLHHYQNPIPLPLLSSLRLPFPLLRFLRLFPSAFHLHPSHHVAPTPSLLSLHQQELQIQHQTLAKTLAFRRLARLLMLTRRRKIPLKLLDHLQFDLGLPFNYISAIIFDHPDSFEIVGGDVGSDLDLILTRWDPSLAVSDTESSGRGAFFIDMPRGYEVDKRIKSWMEEFQNLPYVSPYEDGTHLDWDGGVYEKWTVAVMHEMLCLCVGKKTEMANLVEIGKLVGLRERDWKVLRRYPGIFYVSNKNRTQTVVLREAYRKGRLLEKDALVGMRYRYLYLMRRRPEEGAEHVYEDEWIGECEDSGSGLVVGSAAGI